MEASQGIHPENHLFQGSRGHCADDHSVGFIEVAVGVSNGFSRSSGGQGAHDSGKANPQTLVPPLSGGAGQVLEIPAAGIAEDGDLHAWDGLDRDLLAAGSNGGSDSETLAKDLGADLAEGVHLARVDVEETYHGRAEQVRVDLIEVVSGVGEDFQERSAVGIGG